YYASGWKTFGSGTTPATMELLPNTYPFKISYGGASNEKSQNTASDPSVEFATGLVTFDLESSTGSSLAGGATYYASGWKTFGSGTTSTSMELLPASYPFKVSYGGASQQATQNTGTDASVEFATVLASMKLLDGSLTELPGTATYYASGWHTFGSGTATTTMELLPVTHTFKMVYSGSSHSKNQNLGTDADVVFNWNGSSVYKVDPNSINEDEDEDLTYNTGWNNVYPNPFNNMISLDFSLASDQYVTIALYNINGALVSTIVDGEMAVGDHTVRWNSVGATGSEIAKGTYFIKLITQDQVHQTSIIKY
ncbi:MAG: T9SS type A sorting domain-containing protein, partial [Bacteroidia bacterium]